MNKTAIVSFYGANTDPNVVAYQKKVFEKFSGEYTHHQLVGSGFYIKDNVTYGHGTNINNFINNSDADIFIFMDIDCIPLNADTIPYLIDQASKGALVGEIQRSNHIENGQHLYAGSPCFAISRETYDRIGQPSCEPTPRGDTVEELTYRCEEYGIPVVLCWPVHSDTHQWNLRDSKTYGIGTTFEHGIYHQFCIRHGNGEKFINRCKRVLGEKDNAVIISACVGYPPEIKEGFIKNLKEHGYSGDVAILDWKRAGAGGSFCLERVKAYHDVTQALAGAGYDTVITTDVRDVLFQGNPAKIQHSDLDFFLEDEGMTIKKCQYNSQWVRDEFGQEVLDQIGDNPISCAGFIIGKPEAMADLCTKMWDICRKSSTRGFFDQGVHNYLLYTGKVNARAVGNEEGDVYTVGYVPAPLTVKGGKVYNKAGKIPVVVHQHDRHFKKIEDVNE